jgi:hypothetical protein
MSPSDIAALGADEAPAAQSGQLESQKTQIETLLAYTEEIERAIAANLEYAALALALALPDICVSLNLTVEAGTGARMQNGASVITSPLRVSRKVSRRRS